MIQPCALLSSALLLAACGGSPGPSAPPRSVLLISIDTLRADRLGCYGHASAETPHIDALAARGVTFDQTFATVPITLPSHTSLLTGTLPPYHGVRDNGTHRVAPELTTLAEVLAGRGWRTAAFTAAFVLDAQYGLDQGFEVYGDPPLRRFGSGSDIQERPAGEVNAEASAWLDRLGPDEPFFVWAHYFEPHHPYPPAAELPPHLRARPYDAEIATADRAVGELLEDLERRGRLAETLVVLTSDHGESLGEHGEETHSYFVYQSTLRVPLVFAHDSLRRGAHVDTWASTVDVMPTVLELLGVEPPAVPPPGRSLAPLLTDDEASVPDAPIYFESHNAWLNYGWAPLAGVALAGRKLIEAPRPELFDLAQDPDEAEDLSASEPETLARLREHLGRLRTENARPVGFGAAEREVSPAERERLAGLGYTGSSSVPAEGPGGTELRDPKDGLALVQRKERAFILFSQGRLDEVRPLLEELLREDPTNPVFLSNLGALLLNQGHYRQAIPYLERSLAGGFRSADNLASLAQCLMLSDRAAEAEPLLREALERDAKHLLSLDLLAQILARRGERAEARRCVESFLELWRGDPRTAREMRERLRALGG